MTSKRFVIAQGLTSHFQIKFWASMSAKPALIFESYVTFFAWIGDQLATSLMFPKYPKVVKSLVTALTVVFWWHANVRSHTVYRSQVMFQIIWTTLSSSALKHFKAHWTSFSLTEIDVLIHVVFQGRWGAKYFVVTFYTNYWCVTIWVWLQMPVQFSKGLQCNRGQESFKTRLELVFGKVTDSICFHFQNARLADKLITTFKPKQHIILL